MTQGKQTHGRVSQRGRGREDADTLTGASMGVTLIKVQKTDRHPREKVSKEAVKRGRKEMEENDEGE